MIKIMSDEKLILDYVDLNTVGVLWLSDVNITEYPWGYSVMDYLLDGAVATSISRRDNKDDDQELFLTEAFNRKFYLNFINLQSVLKTAFKTISQRPNPNPNMNEDKLIWLIEKFKNFSEIVKGYNLKIVVVMSFKDLMWKNFFINELIPKIDLELNYEYPKTKFQYLIG
ncbi:MAG: hypothetical protein HQK51_00495 [Oligoflexia bacterium]|nr:hypothetical protein [Oligoflexia bacterium]